MYFPQFVKLIPKKSKRCKNGTCTKFIVQVEDYGKKLSQKFELCHLFINQLPYCTITKVDFTQKVIHLKFIIFDYKEAKISFQESSLSKWKVNLPLEKYEITDTSLGESGEFLYHNVDPFIINKSDRCIILKFSWGEKIDNDKGYLTSDDKKEEFIDWEKLSKVDEVVDKFKEEEENENLKKLNAIKKKITGDLDNVKRYEPVVIRFIVKAEYFRLENQELLYEYEVKVSP